MIFLSDTERSEEYGITYKYRAEGEEYEVFIQCLKPQPLLAMLGALRAKPANLPVPLISGVVDVSLVWGWGRGGRMLTFLFIFKTLYFLNRNDRARCDESFGPLNFLLR